MIRFLPAQADTLHQQLLVYRIVRKRLLDRDPGQVIGGLERYLAGVVVALDAFAAATPRVKGERSSAFVADDHGVAVCRGR